MQRAATVIEQLFHHNYILASISSRNENGSYILCPFLHLNLSFINLMFVCFMPSMNSNSDFFFRLSLFSVSSTEMSCLSVCLNIYVNVSFKALITHTPYLCPDDTAPSARSKSALLYLL